MSFPKPYISVVTPVFNASQTIRRTIESLRSQRASFEHVVCDGGSTDGTQDIVREYLGTYPVELRQVQKGGIYVDVADTHKMTSGEVMCWINGDDFYLPFTLAIVEAVFKAYPNVQWITGIPSWHWEGTQLWSVAPYTPIYDRGFLKRGWHQEARLGPIQQEGLFWRRSLYEKADGDAILRRYRLGADYQLWKAFAAHAELHTVRAPLAVFTFRPGQISSVFRAQYNAECGVTERSLNFRLPGRIFMRLYSFLNHSRAIKPENLVPPANGNPATTKS